MNKNFYTPENIEAYIDNTLSAGDRAFFESEIAKDPLLQNEVSLQRDIITSLKEHRKAQLKNRLNNIDVSSAPNFIGIKIAASIVVTGLLGWGTYSYFKSDNKTETVQENKVISINSNSKQEVITESSNKSNSDNVITENNVAKNNVGKKANPVSPVTGQEHVNASPIDVEAFDNESFQKDANISLPDGKIAQTTVTKSGLDIDVIKDSDKKFHYKYFNNKLFLYGNFDSKTYEILDVNTPSGEKQLYLYFENNYYQLSNQTDVTSLSKITDKKMIEMLNQINK